MTSIAIIAAFVVAVILLALFPSPKPAQPASLCPVKAGSAVKLGDDLYLYPFDLQLPCRWLPLEGRA